MRRARAPWIGNFGIGAAGIRAVGIFVVASLLSSAALAVAQAQNKPDLADRLAAVRSGELLVDTNAARFADILKDAGYRAEIVTGTKTPHVRAGLSGYNVQIFFYDCKDACTSFQFHAGFKKQKNLTLAFANKWNNERRYGKAYVDGDGDFVMEFDVDLDGGVSKAFLKEKILLFERVLAEFDKFNSEK